MSHRARIISLCAALFALNAAIAWPLFRVEYLDDFQSVEGIFISFGRFLLDHWPESNWFPWFDAGMPMENTYLPLVSYMVAAFAWLARTSPAHALHFLSALFYSLGPVFLFLFVRKLAGRTMPALLASVFWSLLSPSSLIPALYRDIGTIWGSRRLKNIVYYGETPHAIAIELLPLTLLLIARSLDKPTLRRGALASLGIVAMMLSNTFGIVVVVASTMVLVCTRSDFGRRCGFLAAGMFAAAYLLICRFLPPSLAELITTNAQSIGGDYRFTWKARLFAVAFAVGLVALAWTVRRIFEPAMRFALLLSICFTGIVVLFYGWGISFVPQPNRYQLEMDLSVCMLAGIAADSVVRHLPRRQTMLVAALALSAFGWIAARNCEFARGLIQPVDITRSLVYREARWLHDQMPGQRVFVAGQDEFWLSLFTDNPQLSAGHDPSAPNWVQHVAVYQIYSGQNAGASDGAVSVFWLKAFGVSAIAVPGPNSADAYHGVANPRKFEGLLPAVWRENDETIYKAPLRSTSLAHVIPTAALVQRRPIHGLDLDAARAYVAALDDPSLPRATLIWRNPDHGRISADVEPHQVISLQVNYDPGWQASRNGRQLRLRPDGLGLIIIEPDRAGRCDIDVLFRGGAERTFCTLISLITALGFLAALLWPPKVRIP